MPQISTKITMNVGNPDRAFDFQRLPNMGVGLARLEFIIANMIGIHPKALLESEKLPLDIRARIEILATGYKSPIDFYIEKVIFARIFTIRLRISSEILNLIIKPSI